MRPELGAPSPLERQGVLALRCWLEALCLLAESLTPYFRSSCTRVGAHAGCCCVFSKYGWTGVPGDLQLGGRVRSVEEKLNN